MEGSVKSRDFERVLVESPYAPHTAHVPEGEDLSADLMENIRFGRLCMKDCLLRGEAPFASHLLYTQEGVLDDTIPEERELGIEAGLYWGREAEKSVFYINRGFSWGMKQGLEEAIDRGRHAVFRLLNDYEIRCDSLLSEIFKESKSCDRENHTVQQALISISDVVWLPDFLYENGGRVDT